MKSISQAKDLKGKRVLVRVDFNVPIKDNKVTDPFRIEAAMETIHFLVKKEAKVILISHIGNDGTQSLQPVADYLNKEIKITFINEVIGEKVKEAVNNMQDGDVLLLENLRKEAGEMNNDKLFALELSELGELYVNEAFSVSHREHASVVLVPKMLPSYAGFGFEKEIEKLDNVLHHPHHPFLFILGGAKFETKMPLITKFLETADTVFVGGALEDNFFLEEGLEIGDSLVDKDVKDLGDILKNKKLMLPLDAVVEHGSEKTIKKVDELHKHDVIVDIGPDTVAMLAPKIHEAKMILWNGPMGKGTNIGGTRALLHLLEKSKAERIVGGGDTIEVISLLKLGKNVGFVSTGGGATLDYLAKGTLPGLEALEK